MNYTDVQLENLKYNLSQTSSFNAKSLKVICGKLVVDYHGNLWLNRHEYIGGVNEITLSNVNKYVLDNKINCIDMEQFIKTQLDYELYS